MLIDISLIEFAEKYVDKDLTPYQERMLEMFNREEKKNEFALLPHEYGTRFAPIRTEIFEHHNTKDFLCGCTGDNCPICQALKNKVSEFLSEEEMKI